MDERPDDDLCVLHLITRFFYGGAETTTLNAVDALEESEEKYDVRLGVGNGHDPERLSNVKERGISTVVFRTIRHYNPVTAVFAVFAVALYLHQERIDVLHTHSTEAGVIGRLAGFLVRTPVVVHEVHGDPITDDRGPLLNAFLLSAERVAARLTTRLIVKSERIKRSYLERGIGRPEQYTLIYHGVDVARFRAAVASTRSNTTPERHRAIFVGRLAEGKGLFDLLEAVEQIELDLELQIVGEGELNDDLKREAERRDLDGVDLIGYREDVPELLAAADLLVLPSHREGTPRVVTEALATGTPVVSTNIAGIPEQVTDGETGYLVEPGDVDALSGRIEELLTDPHKRRQFGDRAAQTVEKFDVEESKNRYRRLYSELSTELSEGS